MFLSEVNHCVVIAFTFCIKQGGWLRIDYTLLSTSCDKNEPLMYRSKSPVLSLTFASKLAEPYSGYISAEADFSNHCNRFWHLVNHGVIWMEKGHKTEKVYIYFSLICPVVPLPLISVFCSISRSISRSGPPALTTVSRIHNYSTAYMTNAKYSSGPSILKRNRYVIHHLVFSVSFPEYFD
ncbi:uncharacterized protein BDR25DRAFT_362998 [Lindgomyces ingoldianus]|uniref:Uncharacterized protein n=1 Tax=Lindgomyces ingoldianus TaxID=673940 RepID=A0ACB6Q8P5_9PLEO|nr:uncharacterized protein BDR25DRAFT_362998 [Lindgomyces ingoldianus]KAF2463276.1 hypothetical protein BDR25DRAFT_362998 [Lindgomyces ingoldianus]